VENAAISGMTPTTVNSLVRTREYLTEAEIERLMAAARKGSRYGHRDATMILVGYRHGLRASELCDLQWSQVELNTGRLHVRRAKNGSPSVHPLQGDEIRALRRLQREQGPSSHVFMTERAGPMTPKAFHALFGRSGPGRRCHFRSIRTCCAMAAAMDWIRDCAQACAKRGVPLEWMSATRFPCSNLYREIKTRRVEIIRDRIALKRKVAVGHTTKINAQKAADSAAANFIHSCDASHLIRTALVCAEEGIDLLTIHDCFATHAPNARRLHQILRSQLAVMHLPDLLSWLGENPPEREDLDLIGIQNAEFTFA